MPSYDDLAAANAAIRKVLDAGAEAKLRAIAGVRHVSVGLKVLDRVVTRELCVRVYVARKRSRQELPAAELIPADIGGIATDVNTVADFAFQADNTRYRPIVKGGIQISNGIVGAGAAGSAQQLSRGTLGCIALDKTDNSAVLLSNWHVLEANTGTSGDKVFQPAPTWLPALTPGQLPFHPTDDTDKIAVVRRSVISDKVDAAIAKIDVSSCCHCCGVRCSNEINGLSVNGRPARSTLIGDEPAVAGMTVFKVGQSTLRTEGVVVDADYPPFAIQHGSAGYPFTGQIAIQNIDHAKQFSDIGDSGAVVVNMDNKIVGLVFAAGKDVAAGGGPQPFVTVANHISDVFSALNIRIAYSPDVVVTAGQALADVPPVVNEATIPEPYRALRERMQTRDVTAHLFALGERHRDEVLHLINHCRPVMVAWHRCQGPALLATLMGAVRDGHYKLPARVKGVALHEALERMRAVLSQHGSAGLVESLSRAEADAVIEACVGSKDLNEVIERITCDWAPRAVPEGVGE